MEGIGSWIVMCLFFALTAITAIIGLLSGDWAWAWTSFVWLIEFVLVIVCWSLTIKLQSEPNRTGTDIAIGSVALLGAIVLSIVCTFGAIGVLEGPCSNRQTSTCIPQRK